MRLKPKLIPYIALGMGMLGFFLRVWLFESGTDRTGLLMADHPGNGLIFFVCAVTMLLLALAVGGLKNTPAHTELFPYSTFAGVGNFVAAGGVVLALIAELSKKQDLITLLCAILGILAAGALVFLGVFRIKQLRPRYYFHAMVTLYLMVHLVCQYRAWNTEPQLQNYFPQLLASVFLMLGMYHRTMLDSGADNRRAYVFFLYGAVFFCLLAVRSSSGLFYLSMTLWALSGHCSLENGPKPMPLPQEVLFCIRRLEKNGYHAYAVGGCVRDHLLGLNPHDYDLCTNATPEQICSVFFEHRLVLAGQAHGTIGVVVNGQLFEITTFRAEGDYSDSRHPDWVSFVDSIEEDLARRDFTVNAIAYNPSQGYIDPFGGQKDLRARILRAVGDPERRFREDALRILRGVRFATRFRMKLEEKTAAAMSLCKPLMDDLARERVFDELCRFLPSASAGDLIRFAPILTQIIPELAPAVGFEQHSSHHRYDVFTHIAHTVESVLPNVPLRLAALLHDIGKPQTFSVDENGSGHFYNHAKIGAEMAAQILLRFKASNALSSQVLFLIEHHMMVLTPDKKLLRRYLGKYGEDMILQLLELQKADFNSKGVRDSEDPFAEIERLLAEIQDEDACLTVKDLAVNGFDLLCLGTEPGPHIGRCMAFLLDLVQEEILANTRDDLLLAAKQYLTDNQEV